ncbi:MAG: N-6 DNA methylase, partial [Nitrospirota bacterium]|nr:N-6 DNA methylase [Nitrospirota bacterium]
MVARPRPDVNGQLRPILAELEKITRRGYDHWSVFDDWLELILTALMRNDPEYLKIMSRYRNNAEPGSREADHFANAFGLLMQRMAETNSELLGEIYEAWEITNRHAGQFFTPWTVCQLMAQLTGPPAAGASVNDPCSGSGRLLVATARITPARDLDTITFVAQDIDRTCVVMTALNMTFFNLNAYIFEGNSLGLEIHRAYQTTRSSIGGSIREMPKEEIPQPVREPAQKEVISK